MKYFIKKFCTLIITLFIVSLLAFLAFQVIPGDPTTALLGTEAGKRCARSWALTSLCWSDTLIGF